METEKFIKIQVAMIKNQFELSQIRDEVYRYVFRHNIGNANINSMIEMCM